MRNPFRLDLARPSRRHWLGYLLLAPAVALIAFLIVYPLFVSLEVSFQNVGIVRLDRPNGPLSLDNYARLATSPDFWHAVLVMFELVAVVTSACFVVGLGTALLVNQRFRGRAVARVLVALPWAVPEIIAVVIFSWLFDSSYGLVNWLLVKLHLSAGSVAWLSSPGGAFLVVAVTMIWKGYPFVSIMALAGLQAIPEDYYNAARVDGASTLQRFVHITVPCLMPVLGVSLVLSMLWVFRDFSIIATMTGGGPIHATQTLSLMTYEQAFSFSKMGYASAIGVVTLVICIVASRLMMGRAPDRL